MLGGVERHRPRRAAGTLAELFAAQVGADPGRAAGWSATASLSYAELDARANRLARLLAARGAGPERGGRAVLPRSAELVVAALGVAQGRRGVPADRPGATRPTGWRSCSTDARPVLLADR